MEYCDSISLDSERAKVHVSHDKVHAEDCAHCEEATGKVDHFFRKIKLSGALDEAQHKRVMEIADKCPVHRTLESETHIITESI